MTEGDGETKERVRARKRERKVGGNEGDGVGEREMEKGDRTKETEEGRIGEIKKIRERERRTGEQRHSGCYSVRSSRKELLPQGLLPCVTPRQQPTGPEPRRSALQEPWSKAAGS